MPEGCRHAGARSPRIKEPYVPANRYWTLFQQILHRAEQGAGQGGHGFGGGLVQVLAALLVLLDAAHRHAGDDGQLGLAQLRSHAPHAQRRPEEAGAAFIQRILEMADVHLVVGVVHLSDVLDGRDAVDHVEGHRRLPLVAGKRPTAPVLRAAVVAVTHPGTRRLLCLYLYRDAEGQLRPRASRNESVVSGPEAAGEAGSEEQPIELPQPEAHAAHGHIQHTGVLTGRENYAKHKEMRLILMNDFFRESLFAGVTLSLLSYFIGSVLKKKFKLGIFNPLLISIIITIIVLAVSGVDYDVYNQGARYLSWFLTPATVCLAIPLYEQWSLLKKNYKAVVVGIASGVLTSLTTVLVLSKIMNLSHAEYVTLLPKSITTAIGMGVSEELGGYVTITVAVIVVTGVLGNIFGELICKIFRIKEPIAKGLALGSAAHAIGTAKAMEMGEIEGAMSSLSIAVAGILTVVLSSVFAGFM